MSWWYVSSPRMTCAVKVEDGRVVEAPPILRRFVGQPAKNLGAWMRSQGEARFERLEDSAAPLVRATPKADEPSTTANGPRGASPVGNDGGKGAAEYTYSWGNNPKRETLKGRPCRILRRGAMRSVLVEFENGQQEVVSIRALRKEMRYPSNS